MSLCIKALEEENKQYKEAIIGYRERNERLQSDVEKAKEIYGNKIWRYLKKRVNISDEDYDDFMRFLDS